MKIIIIATFLKIASFTVLAALIMVVPPTQAATGGGISPERHETCTTYGEFATQVWRLKSAGYDQNSAGAKLIGKYEAMRVPALAKKILDITRYVYGKSMNEDSARDGTYNLCASGKLEDM